MDFHELSPKQQLEVYVETETKALVCLWYQNYEPGFWNSLMNNFKHHLYHCIHPGDFCCYCKAGNLSDCKTTNTFEEPDFDNLFYKSQGTSCVMLKTKTAAETCICSFLPKPSPDIKSLNFSAICQLNELFCFSTPSFPMNIFQHLDQDILHKIRDTMSTLKKDNINDDELQKMWELLEKCMLDVAYRIGGWFKGYVKKQIERYKEMAKAIKFLKEEQERLNALMYEELHDSGIDAECGLISVDKENVAAKPKPSDDESMLDKIKDEDAIGLIKKDKRKKKKITDWKKEKEMTEERQVLDEMLDAIREVTSKIGQIMNKKDEIQYLEEKLKSTESEQETFEEEIGEVFQPSKDQHHQRGLSVDQDSQRLDLDKPELNDTVLPEPIRPTAVDDYKRAREALSIHGDEAEFLIGERKKYEQKIRALSNNNSRQEQQLQQQIKSYIEDIDKLKTKIKEKERLFDIKDADNQEKTMLKDVLSNMERLLPTHKKIRQMQKAVKAYGEDLESTQNKLNELGAGDELPNYMNTEDEIFKKLLTKMKRESVLTLSETVTKTSELNLTSTKLECSSTEEIGSDDEHHGDKVDTSPWALVERRRMIDHAIWKLYAEIADAENEVVEKEKEKTEHEAKLKGQKDCHDKKKTDTEIVWLENRIETIHGLKKTLKKDLKELKVYGEFKNEVESMEKGMERVKKMFNEKHNDPASHDKIKEIKKEIEKRLTEVMKMFGAIPTQDMESQTKEEIEALKRDIKNKEKEVSMSEKALINKTRNEMERKEVEIKQIRERIKSMEMEIVKYKQLSENQWIRVDIERKRKGLTNRIKSLREKIEESNKELKRYQQEFLEYWVIDDEDEGFDEIDIQKNMTEIKREIRKQLRLYLDEKDRYDINIDSYSKEEDKIYTKEKVEDLETLKPGDSIGFIRCGGLYYHHAIVTHVISESRFSFIEFTAKMEDVIGFIRSKVTGAGKSLGFLYQTIEEKSNCTEIFRYNYKNKRRDGFHPLDVARILLFEGLPKNYDLFKFNCEHFSSFCVTGEPFSKQTGKFNREAETRLDKIVKTKMVTLPGHVTNCLFCQHSHLIY